MKNFNLFIILLSFISTSAAQTWIRQNPFPQLAQMEDISFDGAYGLAVGGESTIFTTDNEGITWIPRNAPQSGQYYQAALVVPGTLGQLLFAGGYDLIVSHDGGQSWEVANINVQLVYKIQALANGSLMVHDSDSGYISHDGGDHWDPFPMPGNNITSGHFTTELNGWVQYGGFNNNQVWITTDGGDSWNVRDTLRHPIISAIEMIDDQTGFLGSRDYVYKTIDGGFVWTRLHDNPVNSILDLHVVNENELWACQNNGFIFYTLDGGGFWQDINPNIINSNRATGIYATDEGKVWVTGKYVSIIYSENYGDDWIDQIPNAKSTLFQPHFVNENIGIVGGSEGTLLKTTNGGASWDKIQFAEEENFFSVQMPTPQIMILGSSTGKILVSIDQGANWSTIGENLGQINDFLFINMANGIVVNESGRIYKTINGGAQWDEVFYDPSDILFGLDFVDPLQGWACGWYGEILYTEDGGNNWDSQYHDDRNQFEDIDFTTKLEGWVVSSNFTDTIWHTTDGGDTWNISILPYKTFWHSVSFTNPDTGWVAGGSNGSGIILRTNDGGQSWMLDHQSPEALFGIYAVLQKETVWSVGVGGNIVKYSPCTFLPTLSNLEGNLVPCEKDTVTYTVESSDVDLFEWSYPLDWLVYGNSNTSSIQFIVGTELGEISVVGKDACGNETGPLIINVFPNPVPDLIITEDGGVLTSNLASGLFQWLLDGSTIPGADQQTYTPIEGGTYELVLTTFATGCEVRSNAIHVVLSGTSRLDSQYLILYPNPSNDLLHFQLNSNESVPPDGMITILGLDGKVKMKSRIFTPQLSVSSLEPGVYLFVYQADNKFYQEKIIVDKKH